MVYGILSLVCVSIPLLSRVHVESMALLAAVGYFAAGTVAMRRLRSGSSDGFNSVLRGRLGWLLLPLAVLMVSVLWVPNCDYWRGLLFFPLFPVITIGFSVSLAWLLSRFELSVRWHVLLGFAIIVAGPVYDLGFHPQFYTYNHVFGGILGPLYDEDLVIRSGLFVFRGMTVLWSVAFVLGGILRDDRRRRKRRTWHLKAALIAVLVLLGGSYVWSSEIGINTTSSSLASRLPGLLKTEHFDIHFDPARTDSSIYQFWIDEHEFRYERLATLTGANPQRIDSYIYPDANVRGELTGARVTSVTPVWLSTPQVHVLEEQFEEVFPHELAHVFGREFGVPILHASPLVGLVEGFAVASEPSDGHPSPDELVLGSGLSSTEMENQIADVLSPIGFWSGRGAVSYTFTGSFVKYLIRVYGMKAFKKAYRTGAVGTSYGRSPGSLAEEWVGYLKKYSFVNKDAHRSAGERFSVPSLFERRCPHWVPVRVREYRRAVNLLESSAISEAALILNRLVRNFPKFRQARIAWARTALTLGLTQSVLDVYSGLNLRVQSFSDLLIQGDAHAMDGNPSQARKFYREARYAIPSYMRDARVRTSLRYLLATEPELLSEIVSLEPQDGRLGRLDSLVANKKVASGGNTDGLQPLVRWAVLVEEAYQVENTGRFRTAASMYEEALSLVDLSYSSAVIRQYRSVDQRSDSVHSWNSGLAPFADVISFADQGLSTAEYRELIGEIEFRLAISALHDGDNEASFAYAESAFQKFRNAGDFSGATYARDLVEKLLWLLNTDRKP